MDFTTRLKSIIEQSQLSASDFATTIDVQASSISHILSGRNKASLDFLMKIKDRYPHFNWDWLIKGEGPMLNPEKALNHASGEPNAFNLFSAALRPEEPNLENMVRSEERPYYATSQASAQSPSPSPSGANGKITKIIIFYENGKFETFEP